MDYIGLISICAIGIIFVAILFYLKKKGMREGYRDPIWMDKSKMWNDQYMRSNGSIYGSSCPWLPYNMFSGYTVYPKAY